MKPDDFYNLTPLEFSWMAKGFLKKEQFTYRNTWEQTRQVVTSVLRPYLPKGNTKTAQKLMPLPWDIDDAGQLNSGEVSQEDMQAVIDAWAAFDTLKEQANVPE